MQVEMRAHRTEARNTGQPNQILRNLLNNKQSKTNDYLRWSEMLLMMTRAVANMASHLVTMVVTLTCSWML